MTLGFSVEISEESTHSNQNSEEYRIVRRHGCALIFGHIPLADFASLTSLFDEDAFLSTDAARMSGANFVMGSDADLCALIEHLKPEALERTASELKERGEYEKLHPEEISWLAAGERGQSSNAIFTATTGINAGGEESTPSDVSDFRRCRLLLDQCPKIANQFKRKMAGVGQWDVFLEHWDTLCHLMDQEVPNWRASPKTGRPWSAKMTYQKMKEIRGETHSSLRMRFQCGKS